MYRYKQNCPAVFAGLGTYREVAHVIYDHNGMSEYASAPDTRSRAACNALQTSLRRLLRRAMIARTMIS